MSLPFLKMHGAGNDFVIFDARETSIRLTPEQVRAIAACDNATTGGCDQVIVMESSKSADVFMRIYNADGSEVASCGNATRCVASLLEEDLARLPVVIETKAGLLQGLEKAYTDSDEEYILVDMGAARFGWQEIPLAIPVADAVKKVEALSGLKNPAFASMGNPHVIFFVSDAEELSSIDLEKIGPALEHYTDVFSEGINISIASLRPASDGLGHIIHARVWERGAGLTKACGTAACAMLAAAHAKDNTVNNIHVWFEPDAHQVTVKMEESDHILLGGPVEKEFEGTLDV